MSANSRFSILVVAACVSGCASGRSAGGHETGQTLQELALDAAHTGMTREQFAATMRAFEDAVADAIEKRAMLEHRKLPAAYRTVVSDFTRRYVDYDGVCAEVADFYASEFTAAELREIAAFQRTAVYQKQVSLTPQMLRRGFTLARKALAEHQHEVYAKIAELSTQGDAERPQ